MKVRIQFGQAEIKLVLRGHYAYYGIAGHIGALQRVCRPVGRYWRKMLRTRSRASRFTWSVFNEIKLRTPLLRPKLRPPYREYLPICAHCTPMPSADGELRRAHPMLQTERQGQCMQKTLETAKPVRTWLRDLD